ncbi:MAG: PD40 domain-containing protein [Chloroflexi bacterium]|nr:PD40 domain-containing protein [Chloroflexota bacterium]
MPTIRGNIFTRYFMTLSVFLVLMVVAMACSSAPTPIVFTTDRDGNLEIYATDISGEIVTNLTNSPTNEFSPVLSPDRRSVAFRSGTPENNSIEVISLKSGDRKQITQRTGNHGDQRWSPTSDRLVYLVENGSAPSIFIADSDGANALPLTTIRGDEVGGWSSDGKAVTFAVRDGPSRGIYVRNPDGVNEFQLTDQLDYSPVWAPGSRKIAFLSKRDGTPDIYVIDTETGDLQRITESEAEEYDVSWSPRGDRLLFVSDQDGSPEIYTISANGKGLQRLTHNTVKDVQPVWSPDGAKIAFVSHLDGDAEIFVMDANGENQTRLTNNDAQDTQPAW